MMTSASNPGISRTLPGCFARMLPYGASVLAVAVGLFFWLQFVFAPTGTHFLALVTAPMVIALVLTRPTALLAEYVRVTHSVKSALIHVGGGALLGLVLGSLALRTGGDFYASPLVSSKLYILGNDAQAIVGFMIGAVLGATVYVYRYVWTRSEMVSLAGVSVGMLTMVFISGETLHLFVATVMGRVLAYIIADLAMGRPDPRLTGPTRILV